MPPQRKSLGVRDDAPCHRRQRPGAGRGRRNGASGIDAEKPAADSRDVRVHDHRICFNTLATRKPDAAGASAGGKNLAGFLAITDRRTKGSCTIGQRAGEAVHATLDTPDAFALDMRDQHQRGRRLER